jgi:hypothetical protein
MLEIPQAAMDILRRFDSDDSAIPVNGAAREGDESAGENLPPLDSLLGGVEAYIRRYVVLPDRACLPVALWTIATHAAKTFECFPYLALFSPAKRCGKTRLLEVLETLASRPWRGTAPTPAALYRMMEDCPTLLLDEVEALNGRNKSETALTILAILNAGHRKGATIPRCDGQKHELKHFPVYGPKAFAVIGRLPDTLTDRSIVITMQRRTADQRVERFLAPRAKTDTKAVRGHLASFGSAYNGAIEQAYNRLLDTDLKFLGDRDADLWIPLFAVCTVAAPGRVAELKQCAVALSTSKAGDDADDSLPLKLLADIREVWPKNERQWETAGLTARLKALDESPWESECELTPRKLARMLRPFGVEARKIRTGERTARGYLHEELSLAFSRYLAAESGTCGTNQ